MVLKQHRDRLFQTEPLDETIERLIDQRAEYTGHSASKQATFLDAGSGPAWN
jgi:hypothetical protein